MDNNIWKIVFFVLLLLYSFIRVPFSLRYKIFKRCGSTKKLQDKIILSITGSGMFIIPGIYVLTTWFDSFNMNLPEYIRISGLTGLLLSMMLFWWVHKYLGDNFSPYLETRENHTLIQDGPYKYVRHPMYTQVWIWIICQWIVLSNWLVGIVSTCSWIILYVIRVKNEEQMLIETFGDEYLNYMKRTGRVFPKL